jgi:hypothetical protein
MKKDIDLEHDCPACHSEGKRLIEERMEVRPAPGDERVLKQWPIQIKLIGTVAPFLADAELLVAADCTAFSIKGFHEKFLGEKKLLIGCPKLDGGMEYVDKFTEMFTNNSIIKVTVVRMEVPCCGGMTAILKEAVKRSGKDIPLEEIILSIQGGVR